ncbi:SCO1431 family membrane protein [Streptomyces sp. SJL17-1]|nr:SCO1431 family membrane protein [Streptomyces sp. SJL17-1]
MTATTYARFLSRARTGGPKDGDGPKILEHVLGWTLVVVLAVFVTRAGLM